MDMKKVIKGLEMCQYASKSHCDGCPYDYNAHGYCNECTADLAADTLSLLKEQEKKQITLHKKHVITWKRVDEFSVRELYEAICETLLDEGELFIARTDDHEKVEFVFYVAESR